MRKLVFTLFAATSLVFANSATDVQANNQANTDINIEAVSEQAAVEQVSTSNASAASGTFRTTVASNVRADAGIGNKIVTVASKGATVKATHKKKVGNITWYRVSVNGTTGWISGILLTSSAGSVSKASSSVSTSAVVSTGLSLIGTPYRFGGTTRAGFDCSGFVQYVFGQSGKKVSRTTLTQFAESTTVSSPRAGDLVFFANTYRAGISHVGIYIGNNQFVHSGGSRAEVVSLNNSYWGPKFHSFKRFN